MTKPGSPATRAAVLIDADNVPPSVLDDVMSAAAGYGSVVVACAYRHWDEPARKRWDPGLRKHGIKRVEQAPGPNATDIALAIDAVDLLHERGLDVLCVVSGDRDFAPLAARLRRGRLTAVLMADPEKVKDSNRALWDDFVQLAVSSRKSTRTSAAAPPGKPARTSAAASAAKPAARPAGAARQANPDLVKAVAARLDDAKTDPDGWARLAVVGREIAAELKKPSLRKALAGEATFEIEDRPFDGKGAPTACIRRLSTGR